MKPSIWSFINYKKSVGTEGLLITGLPGTGKSNMAGFVATLCMKKGECMLTHGDLSCEWRHYYNYNPTIDNILVLIPKELKNNDELGIFGVPDFVQNTFEYVDFETLDITDHLEKHRLTVIYDEAYDISSRAWLWVDQFKRILGRKQQDLVRTAIIYLCHEAGIIWPEIALSDSKLARNHWWAVNTFAEQFVFFRKRLVRPIIISQLAGEIKWQVRKKCMVHVMRRGPIERGAPKKLKRDVSRLGLPKYAVQVGGTDGLYDKGLPATKFQEAKVHWLMIPPIEPLKYKETEEGSKEPNGRQRQIARWKRMREHNLSYEKIAYIDETTKSTVWKGINS